jgi:hypothetical protein
MILEFNKVMPEEMSEKWIDKLYECYKMNPEKFMKISRNMIYDHKYSIMMKDPSLIIPYGIYMVMMQEIEECYVNLVRTNKIEKIEKYKKRREERILEDQKSKEINKIDKYNKVIGDIKK